MAENEKSKTKVVTGMVRLSYAHIWTPQTTDEGKEKYSVCLLISKTDTETIDRIQRAVQAAIERGTAVFGGRTPAPSLLKLPLRDGDAERPEDAAYRSCVFLNASSDTAPQIVDQRVQRILRQEEVYSGCYARVSLNFYAYNTKGNKGIAAGLGNIQKVRDGERLDGRMNAEDEFDCLPEEDDDLLG